MQLKPRATPSCERTACNKALYFPFPASWLFPVVFLGGAFDSERKVNSLPKRLIFCNVTQPAFVKGKIKLLLGFSWYVTYETIVVIYVCERMDCFICFNFF